MIRVELRPTQAPHFVDSNYVRQWWTSVLGPTSTACLRLLVQREEWDEYELAALLGIGNKTRKLESVLARLDSFRAIERQGERFVVVRTHLDWIPEWALDRLPPALRAEHEVVRAETEREVRQ